MPRIWTITAFSVLAFGVRVDACLWDRDTLAGEARGRLDVVSTAVGAFDRNPKRYYEMRAERVAKEIANSSAPDAALFDDLGVALDRLGKSDEAIRVMEQKPAAIARLSSPAKRENQEYRRLANLGTFYAHRWFRAADRRATLSDLREAVRLIGEAIALNPDAHFGRERYQLKALTWLLDGFEHPLVVQQPPGMSEGTVNFAQTFVSGNDSLKDPDDAMRGISGLIQLGLSWESVDAFSALSEAAHKGGHGSLGRLVDLRIEELKRGGAVSLNPHFAERAALGNEVFVISEIRLRSVPLPAHQKRIDEFFGIARGVAEENRVAREAFMNRQFDLGRHPDTYADFWRGVPAVRARPPLPDQTWLEWLAPPPEDVWYPVLIGGGLLIVVAIWLRRRRQRRPSWEERLLPRPGQEALPAGPKHSQ